MANMSTQPPAPSDLSYTSPQLVNPGSSGSPSQPDPVQKNAPAANPRPEQSEGQVARSMEEQTAKLPSDTFLWAALGAMAVSAALQMAGAKKTSLFIGQWAPSFLLLGLYNKIVKVAGSDGQSAGQQQWH